MRVIKSPIYLLVLGIVIFIALSISYSTKLKTNLELVDYDYPTIEADTIHAPVVYPSGFTQKPNNCTTCHNGIEPMMDIKSGMMQEILQLASEAGEEGNDCVVCHGGNSKASTKAEAHSGTLDYFIETPGPKSFYPDPGSPWINDNTCGTCHSEQVRTQFTSLMFTEAGKIQGTAWGFGAPNKYEHNIANYDVAELDLHERLGTDVYKEYYAKLKEAEPQVYPSEMHRLPKAPTKEEVEENPELAVYTYIRQECNRCHTGNKGRQKRGDFRGLGCTSCHIAYSNEGYYEGGDSSVPNEPGHMLVHSMQATRECKVNVHGKQYSGVPVETCTTCHDRGKRIGTNYQGLMETSYSSPFMGDGRNQEKLHSKNYLHLHADIHMDKGMLCQDCHTSLDVHSDGSLAGTTLAPVEIECQDCHGTPRMYPWELPLGYSDEIVGEVPAVGSPRGLTRKLEEYLIKGTVYDPKDGYLISARGNPIPNVVKTGDSILLHTAGGTDLVLKPLKKLFRDGDLSDEAEVAMVSVGKHIDEMECYACHADWAPQCYGCHIKIDYSKPCEKKPDWVAMGQAHDEQGLTADARKEFEEYLIDGEVSEQRSYLRWENPPLAVNGEHRISPAVPGCQTTVTVIGKDGYPLLLNHIFKVDSVEGAGEEGQLAIDMSPTQPHTISKESRECESCHSNPVSMGYGIENGNLYADPSIGYTVDIQSADGQIIPDCTQVQINGIPNLEMDWSRFVTEDGKQLQTVGHHFSGSRPLNNEERAALDRRGVCMSCHEVMPDGDLAMDLIHHVKEVGGVKYDTKAHNSLVQKITRFAAWSQVLIVLGFLILCIFLFRKVWR